jgi:hypothetical protein
MNNATKGVQKMKFTNNEAGFAYGNWSVRVTRTRLGNRMDGYHYHYSYSATECIAQPEGGYKILGATRGEGGKASAIAAIESIKQFRQSTLMVNLVEVF